MDHGISHSILFVCHNIGLLDLGFRIQSTANKSHANCFPWFWYLSHNDDNLALLSILIRDPFRFMVM